MVLNIFTSEDAGNAAVAHDGVAIVARKSLDVSATDSLSISFEM